MNFFGSHGYTDLLSLLLVFAFSGWLFLDGALLVFPLLLVNDSSDDGVFRKVT